jgi:hypothetical protein
MVYTIVSLIPWRFWNKEHADDQKNTRNKLHSERQDPLRGGVSHIPLHSITDPEANACSSLHTDLIDSDKSTSDGRRRKFSNVKRNNTTG